MNIFQMLIERILLLVALVTLVTLVIELSGMYSLDMYNSLGFQVKTFVTLITLERQMFEMINSDMTQQCSDTLESFLAFVTNKVSIFIFGTMFFGLMHIKSNLRIETIGTAIGSMTILEMITEEEEVKNDFHVHLQLSPMQSS